MPCNVLATHKHLQRFFCCLCNYTAQTPKTFTGLYRGISIDLPNSSTRNTANTQAAYAPLVPRRRAYCQAQHLRRYQIPPPRQKLCMSAYPPIIIRYIRVQRCAPVMDPYQTAHLLRGQRLHLYRVSPAAVSILPTPGGLQSGTGQQLWRTGSARHHPPGGAVQRQGRGGRRGTLDGYRLVSFRAFAR